MSIESEITRLVNAKQSLADWLTAQSVSVPDGALLGELVALLEEVLVLSRGNVRVLTTTVEIQDGEILVPGEVTDMQGIDSLCGAVAVQMADPNCTLYMTNATAQYTDSSMNLVASTPANCCRVSSQNLFWCIDPDITAFVPYSEFTVVAFWL